MRSNEECVADVLRTVERGESQRRYHMKRSIVIGGGVLSMACIVLLAMVLSGMPPAPSGVDVTTQGQGMTATALAEGGHLGYVLMGFVGMVLGVAFMLLVVRANGHAEPAKSSNQTDGDERPW